MSTCKILFVDDDPEDHAIFKDAMETVEAGDIIEYAGNGLDALKFLENDYKSGNLPALIILDLNMPMINGTQTLEIVKKDPRFQDIPVIIYSTSVNSFEKDKCMLLGAHSYITKPVSYTQYIETAKVFLHFCSPSN